MSFSLFRTTHVALRASRTFSTSTARPLARMTLIGNLTEQPELSATSTGRDIVRYSIASNSGPRDNRKASYFRVTSFEQDSPRRDFLLSLQKGSFLYVEGDATIRKYEDRDGNPRTSFELVQRDFQVLLSKRPQEEVAEEQAPDS